ncbi:hypothetical protein Ddye_004895 [Dipteronia dyeriana]|uniref:Uncharacterized protein n=1 Tax=Dipteronia dyeriana TaxID=168575 RepID=A0AAE0CP70_9ROSI|nr:hypothetical protein Ddye_004895 [Dipteronia dyeriana]
MINSTIIILIPKVKNEASLSDFRPVSLYNVIYKIIIQALANRLQDCSKIKNILDDYIVALGQEVNFAESALRFSRYISAGERNYMANLMGVQVVQCHTKCLGLPSFSSRNKRRVFAAIKKRVWNKLKGWNDLLFSIGGKEVPLKVVIQAIPTYVISLFKLPRSLINAP